MIKLLLGLTWFAVLSTVNDEPGAKEKAPYTFFTDTIIDISSETPEEALAFLRHYDSLYGLHILTIGDKYYWVEPAHEIEIETAEDECSGVEYGIIHCHGHYLFGGLENVRDGVFQDMINTETYLMPEPYRFEYGGRSYELWAEGEYEGDEIEYARNVVIRFRDLDDGREQQLSHLPYLDDGVPLVWFIGDVDGDGHPDLLLQQGYHYEYHEVHFYASSLAGEGELVGRVGFSAMWRDC